jgi:tRNA A37 threonylcarbamoyladenosine dehydratase
MVRKMPRKPLRMPKKIRRPKRPPPIDPAAIMLRVSEITTTFEATLTPEERLELKRRTEDDKGSTVVYSTADREQAMNDFEMLAAADALESLAGQIQTVVDRKMEKLYQQALEVYYAAEELAKDPEHADVQAHVEAMQRAHVSQYGRPIPPKRVH